MLDLRDNTTILLLFFMAVTVAFVVAFSVQYDALTHGLLLASMFSVLALLIVRRFGGGRDRTD